MSDRFDGEGSVSMLGPDGGYLEHFISLLEAEGSGRAAGAPAEPLTSHRRGHWFKSSIAHHKGNKITIN